MIDSVLDPHVWLVAVRDPEGRVVDFQYVEANRAACAYTGHDYDELMGSFLLDVVPWHRESGMFELLVEVVERGTPVVLDDCAFTRDADSVRRFDVRAAPVGNGVSCGWRDVTEHRRQARALAESEERYRLLAEHSADAVGLFRPDGFCEWGTTPMMLDYGLDPAAPPGTAPWEYLHDDDRPAAVERLVQVATTGEVLPPLEVRLRQPDGSLRWVAITAERVGGEGSNVVVAVRDVEDQVRAREELVRSEAMFRALAEASADVIARSTVDWILQYVSPAITPLFGWLPEELVGVSTTTLWHPDDLPGVEATRNAGRDGDPHWFRARLRCKDGSYRWCEARPTYVPATADEPALFVSVLRDVHEQHLAEQALADSEERFRLLAENASDLVFRGKPSGGVEWVSPSVTALLGWKPEEIVGQRSFPFVHPADMPAVAVALTGLEVRSPQRLEIRARTADGGHRWVRVLVRQALDEHGEVVAVVGSLSDIQAEVEAREALRQSEEHYRLLVENAVGLVYRTSVDGMLQWISPTITSVLGWDAADLLGTRALDLVAAEDLEQVRTLREAVYRGTTVDDFECRFRTADGSVRWMSVHSRPLRDTAGRITSAVVGLRDIQAEVEARQARLESEARYRLLAENASDMVFRANNQEQWEWVSPSITQVMGWRPEELIGRYFFEFVHPEDLPALGSVGAALDRGENQDFQVRLRRADGSYRWTGVQVRPVFDAAGAVVARVGSGIDIQAEVEARQARAESEARYHLLADYASDVVYMTDADGALKWLSPTSERALGWTPDELLGTEFMQLLHPDDQAVAAQTREVFRTRDSAGLAESKLLARVRTKRGDYRWFAGAATRYDDAAGNFAGVVMGLKDVSELVAAQESVARERDRVQATLDSLLDPHAVVEACRDEIGDVEDFVLASANDAACTFLRRTRAGVVGRRISEFMPPDQRRPLELWFRRTIQYGAPIILDDFEYPAPLFGRMRRLDVRGVRVGDAVSFTWRDVTDRHEAARALADSEQRLRQLNAELEDLLTNGSVLALRARRDGRLSWVSGSAPRLLGYPVADLVGTPVADWIHPDDVEGILDAGRLLRAGANAGLVRFRMRTADGSYRTFEGRAFQALEANGEQIVQGTMTDVTEREQAERLRSQLLAVASHELRSPLAFIYASLRLLSAGTVAIDSDTGKDLLERVTATSERLARIADTLLRLQNLELADQLVPAAPVAVGKVVGDAARSTPTERQVRVTCLDHTDGALHLRVDADQLTQAVINLTANAIKHAPDGTEVEVSVSAAPIGMRVEVRDRGAGVPPEHRQAVFQAFHQLQRRDKSAGVGLGLAIVAKIVERHGGRVWADEPDDGVGARFVFEIGEALAVGRARPATGD